MLRFVILSRMYVAKVAYVDNPLSTDSQNATDHSNDLRNA